MCLGRAIPLGKTKMSLKAWSWLIFLKIMREGLLNYLISKSKKELERSKVGGGRKMRVRGKNE